MAEGRGREQAAEQVERLRADRPAPCGLGLLAPRPALLGPRLDLFEASRVDAEELVHRRAVGLAELVVAVVAVAAAGVVRHRLVVRDVAGRLLEIRGQAPALQD